ncbi:hypothetical protein GCM10010377_11280 [Streptomyces viridiviolaceus]|uniref:Uncharacterized protein n=1 Tax=Streptomyces viridiviolaceus TaxID=68282 RepID=A0ABW2ECT0_9ACTN|nr:hypothetical protein [Streptomyces viridiviolaceus]GHB23106.1 hypothetical protein GCM10010377_11280 [Streptomyces viridiviolaceus]
MSDSLAIPLFCVTLALLVAFLALWTIINHRMMIERGWTEWCRTAKALPWRDRWELYRATLRGRAVSDPRLAALAVQRAESCRALIDGCIRRGSPIRWYPLWFASLCLLALVLALVGGTADWLDHRLGGGLVGGMLGALLTYPWYTLLRKRIQRCVDANR